MFENFILGALLILAMNTVLTLRGIERNLDRIADTLEKIERNQQKGK